MQLKKFFVPHWQRCAGYYRIQAYHRKAAIEGALKTFADRAARERAQTSDAFFLDGIETTEKWLGETLIQGAYLREFHIFECEIKEYINNQRKWNEVKDAFRWKKPGENIISRAVAALHEFNVTLCTEYVDTLHQMRRRINSIKHDEGIHLSDFVSLDEYSAAASVIRSLWNELDEKEHPSFPTGLRGRG